MYCDRLLFSRNAAALSVLLEDGDDDDASPNAGDGAKGVQETDTCEELIDDLTGGAPDDRALGGACSNAAADGGEFRALLSESVELMSAACRGVLRTHVAARVAEQATASLEFSLSRAFPTLERLDAGPVPRECSRAATDGATALYVIGASATYVDSNETLMACARAVLVAANGTLRAPGRVPPLFV